MSDINLKPLNDRILFQFLQNTRGNQFRETTISGLEIIETKDKQLKSARWAKVISIGEDVSNEIYPGLYILIENLKWTLHIEYNNNKYWNTSENVVLAVSVDMPEL